MRLAKPFRVSTICLTAICLLLALTGCERPASNVQIGTQNQVLHMGNGTEPRSLDPHIATGVTENNIISALLEGLVAEDPATLKPIPGAAESWTVSGDGRHYLFHLRRNGQWSNGEPVTAADFVFAWQRMLTPTLGAEYAYQLYYLENAEAYHKGKTSDFSQVGVKAIDDYTLSVTLEHPTPFFLSLLTHFSTFPLNKNNVLAHGAIDQRGTRWTRAGNFVGNGPFILDEWALNRIIRVRKNPLYWDSANVTLQGIVFYPIDNAVTEERMFRSGALHLTNTLPSAKVVQYREQNSPFLAMYPYLGTYFYRFNTRKPPFDDARVRRALSMSIDRQKIVEHVTRGGQLPAAAFTPPNTNGYTAESRVPFDIAGARQLLAEAGYPNGEGFPVTELLYNTLDDHRKIAEAIQEMWKEALNIDITLLNQEWKVYLASINKGDYQLARAAWIGDYLDPNTFLDMWTSDSGINRTGWSHSDYDRFIELAASSRDNKQRFHYFQQAEKLLLEQSPVMPIYTYSRIYLKHPDVKGWYNNILDHHPYKAISLQAQIDLSAPTADAGEP